MDKSGLKWITHQKRRILGVSCLKGEVAQMFLGRFEHTIDAKCRLTIPSRYRDQVPEGIYLMQGFDGNLTAYPKQQFENIAEKISEKSITDSENRMLRRFLFSGATWLVFDNLGRILIPSFLMDYAKLGSSVMIIGANDNFEVWNLENWQKIQNRINDPEVNNHCWAAMDISTK
jgi:MraZ protein